MHRIHQDKAQMLIDTVQTYGGSMLRCRVPFREELSGATLAAQGTYCLCKACCKTDNGHNFCFSPFSIKAKIPFRFLLVGENRYKCRSFLKAKWCRISGDISIAISVYLFFKRLISLLLQRERERARVCTGWGAEGEGENLK